MFVICHMSHATTPIESYEVGLWEYYNIWGFNCDITYINSQTLGCTVHVLMEKAAKITSEMSATSVINNLPRNASEDTALK